jgi:hypothetical protein
VEWSSKTQVLHPTLKLPFACVPRHLNPGDLSLPFPKTFEPADQESKQHQKADCDAATTVRVGFRLLGDACAIVATHATHQTTMGSFEDNMLREIETDEIVCPDVWSFYTNILDFTKSKTYMIENIKVFTKSPAPADGATIVDLHCTYLGR